ncbi:hypothetical protein [Nocardioides daphniae]|uniref:Uncharacterized protein n=1 Tax=Nocardioides daphniae TaxID=402297 RepID=A0A4V1CW96_9ACTN|nr:hypothetical protein [Nocardioides daphniae]QCC76497.1 hypothetical protein E2C04_03395 [Nocardioides daphniae]GGD06124.1 hypothetical protein GCM10007231_01050 [Nocardioides daphniae]
MTVFLAWTAAPLPDDEVARLEGPWTELRVAGPGLVLVESTESLSRVYHALKWSLEDEDAALVVTPVLERPKLKGLAPGTTTWLRDRTPRSADGED